LVEIGLQKESDLSNETELRMKLADGSLRFGDVPVSFFDSYLEFLSPIHVKRAKHFFSEIKRVEKGMYIFVCFATIEQCCVFGLN